MGAFSGLISGLSGSGAAEKYSDKRKKKKTSGGADAATNPMSDGGKNTEAGEFKRGGKVKRTGRALVHKGERVLTAKQARKYDRRKRG